MQQNFLARFSTSRKCISAVFCVLLFQSAFALADTCQPERQLICKPMDSSYITSILTKYSLTIVDFLPETYSYLVCVDPGLDVDSILSLTEVDTLVAACHQNFEYDLPEVVQGSQPFVDRPGDENRFSAQPAASNLNLPAVDLTPPGATVAVAVIDVGVDFVHPEFANSTVSGLDYVDNDMNAQDEPNGVASGHGTFIAGLIRRVAPQAEIHAYRVLDTTGRGDGWAVARAIVHAVDAGCKVINLSLVMYDKHSAVDAAIEFARSHNVVVVAAAGNDSSNVERFPAGDSYAIAVTGVDTLNHKAVFANYGNDIDVCAPAISLYAPYPDSSYADWSGTSFAAPLVAAQAAWLFSLKPEATWHEVVDAIRTTAINIDADNPGLPNGSLGKGLINIKGSFAALGLMCGDIDGSGTVSDVGDLTLLVDHLFINFGTLPNPVVANIDGQSGVDIGDLTALVDHLFITFAPISCGL